MEQQAWLYVCKESALSKVISLAAFLETKKVFFKEDLAGKLDNAQHLRARVNFEAGSCVVAEFFPEFDLVYAARVHPCEFEPEENHSVVEIFVGFDEFYWVNLLVSLFFHDALVLCLQLTDKVLVKLVNGGCKITGDGLLLVEALYFLQLFRVAVHFKADFV